MRSSFLFALYVSIGILAGQRYEMALQAKQALLEEARGQIMDELLDQNSSLRAGNEHLKQEITNCTVVQEVIVDAVNAAKPECAKQVKSNTKVLLDRLRVRPEEEE